MEPGIDMHPYQRGEVTSLLDTSRFGNSEVIADIVKIKVPSLVNTLQFPKPHLCTACNKPSSTV